MRQFRVAICFLTLGGLSILAAAFLRREPPIQNSPSPIAPASPMAQSITAEITGEVRDDQRPVAGARVAVQGGAESTLTDRHGRFSLRAVEENARVTAWKNGYYIGFTRVRGPQIKIELKQLPDRDHDDYRWVEPDGPDPTRGNYPTICANCHREIFDEWRGGAHGKPHEGSKFRDLFLGLDAKGQKKGWSLMRDHPDGEHVCASCHNPAPLSRPDHATGVVSKHWGGVHCDFCHKIAGPGGGEIGLTHGKYGLDFLRPKEGRLIFGPLKDAPNAITENTYSAFHKSSRLCASCHEGVVFGVRVYETYSEWQASPAGRSGKQCQDCHMKPTGKMTNFAPGHGGVERDPHTLANHHFFDGSQREMLQRSLKLSLDLARTESEARVTVEVRADGAGHRVPTGLPDRNLTLVVEALDASGKSLACHSGPTLPALVGPESGKAGKLFAKVLKDFDGRSPVPFWRAAPDFEDTRLTPGRPERIAFGFPPGVAKVTAKLVYRKFWPEVTRAKGWPDDAWVVASEEKR